MGDKITKSPHIRFAGFTDDWEQRKFSDGTRKIGDGLHGTPKYTEDGNVYFINGNNLVNGQIVITKETKFVTEGEQSKDDKALDDNTLLMSINGTIGNLAWYNGEKIMLGKSVAYITVSDYDKRFIYAYIQTESIYSYFMNNLTGSTIKNLGLKTIRETNLLVPIKEEQVKIGLFFSKLDNLITLHQRKLELLKVTKKSMLQKMFPKDGESVPEIRFAGFTDAWEQRKLGEAVKFYNGRAYKQIELLEEGKYRVLRVGNFNTNDKWYYSNLELEDNKYADKGDLLYLWATNFGPELWKEERVIYHYHIWKLEIEDKNLDKHYLYTWLETDKERIKQNTNGSTMVHVTKGNMEEREFKFPIFIEEQCKIGRFFNKLDNLITLHQRELDLLKDLKKSMLQQMFI